MRPADFLAGLPPGAVRKASSAAVDALAVPYLWPHETAVILATGPSLTQADVDYCRGKAHIIAVSDAYRLAPWAEVLYSCDAKWWKHHTPALGGFIGYRYALDVQAAQYGVFVLRDTGRYGLEMEPSGLRTGQNSGYQAINLAVHLGATRIILLGFDAMPAADGRDHFFGAHAPQIMSGSPPYGLFFEHWPSIVAPLREAGVTVINCSRRTALNVFPISPLEEVL